ncbi:DUF1640 domain-containing protein [Escherichia coli]|uniref:DUF1640 domain-containing protein n=1 Tax=Escherichia coli TaxID=562 RepID=UPI000BE50443|nr:DUF1640 domain-containing protein [Escherichia coli]PJI56404.1 DUF1640 domain-containing protein [Escherichia coli]PJI61045.1 DUF1640 domain-containing protein [Escherichia coli]
MAQVYFDTLKFVEKLEASGIPAAQARAISDAVRESHESVEVATKRDLDDLKKELRSDMELLRKDLTIKMGGMFVVAVGVLAAIIKLPL